MPQLLAERPRRGGSHTRIRSVHPDAIEEAPHRESMRARYRGERKTPDEHIAPLRRWLRSQVGRPWDDVYSDACRVIDPNSKVRHEMKSRLLAEVERHTFLRDGKVWCAAGASYGCEHPVQRNGRWKQFFVHPKTGLLCLAPSKPPRVNSKPESEQRELNGSALLRRVEGIWYLCVLSPTLPEATRYDLLERRALRAEEARSIYGRDAYCSAKHQLSGRQLQRYGLANEFSAIKRHVR